MAAPGARRRGARPHWPSSRPSCSRPPVRGWSSPSRCPEPRRPTACRSHEDLTASKSLNDFVRTVRGRSVLPGRRRRCRRTCCRTAGGSGSSATPCARPTSTVQKFVRNSMLVLGGECLESVAARRPGRPDPRPFSTATWATGRCRSPACSATATTSSGWRPSGCGPPARPTAIFAFETLGPSMAVFVVAPRQDPAAARAAGHRAGPGRHRPAHVGCSSRGGTGGWVYLYGTARPKAKGIFGFSLRVARTRRRRPARATRSGSTGTDAPGRAPPRRREVLIPSDGGVSQTLSVFHRGDRWYAVSKRDEFLGTDLVVWTAPSPTGPFDSGTTVAPCPRTPRPASCATCRSPTRT